MMEIIRMHSDSDTEAFDTFAKLLNEYIAETGWEPNKE
jgi:hypothetical protein